MGPNLSLTESRDAAGELNGMTLSNLPEGVVRDRPPCVLCDRDCECDGLKIVVTRFFKKDELRNMLTRCSMLDDEQVDKFIDVLEDAVNIETGKIPTSYETAITIVGTRYDDASEEIESECVYEVQFKSSKGKWQSLLRDTAQTPEEGAVLLAAARQNFPTENTRLAKVCRIVAMLPLEESTI